MSIIKYLYAAGPILGQSDAECKDWREELTARVKPLGIQIKNPMDRDYRGKEVDNIADIVEDDKRDINFCDGIVVRYTAPSVGTSQEEIYAWENGKYVFLWITPEAKQPVSPWLLYHAHVVVYSLDNLIDVLTALNVTPDVPHTN